MIILPRIGQICQLKNQAWTYDSKFSPLSIVTDYRVYSIILDTHIHKDEQYVKLRSLNNKDSYYCKIGDIIYEEIY